MSNKSIIDFRPQSSACDFVRISEIFLGCKSIWELWVEHAPFTWGDADRGLFQKERILKYFSGEFKELCKGNEAALELAQRRLLSSTVEFVDLEN